MNMLLDRTTVDMYREECCKCGVIFAMTQDMYENRLEDGGTFYCPNGHPQHYTKKKDLEKKIKDLKERLQTARNQATYSQQEAERRSKSIRAYKGHLTRLKMKVADGRCPCCNTHFEDLHQHMQSEHPDYVEGES